MRTVIGNCGNRPVSLLEGGYERQTLICGPTGYGKSSLLEVMSLQFARWGEGLFMPDRDGKTADDTLAYLQDLGKTDRVVYFKPEEIAFGLDPFQHITPEQMPARVEEIARAIGRSKNIDNFKDQMRRSRWLENAIYLCGAKDKRGRYLGLHRAEDVLDASPKGAWRRMFENRKHNLPPRVRQDFTSLMLMSLTQKEQHTESSGNILRSFFKASLISELFDPNRRAIDWKSTIGRKLVILANLQSTDILSDEQADAIASLMIRMAMLASYRVQSPYYLVIDEADKVLGEDIGDAYARARKRKLRLILAIQDLTSLKNKQVDITGKVMTMPDLVISFNQKGDQELEHFSKLFATGILDFTQQYRPMDRPDGFDWIRLVERTFSRTAGSNNSRGLTKTDQVGQSRADGTQKTKSRGWAFTDTWNDTDSSSDSAGSSNSESETENSGRGAVFNPGGGLYSSLTSDSESESKGKGKSSTKTHTSTKGNSRARGGSHGHNTGTSEGESLVLTDNRSVANGVQEQHGVSNGVTAGASEKFVQQPRYREELYAAGLLYSVQEQYAMMQRILRRLGIGQVLLQYHNLPCVPVQITHLPPPRSDIRKFIECQNPQLFFKPSIGVNGTHSNSRSSAKAQGQSRKSKKSAGSAATKALADAHKNSGNGEKSNRSDKSK